MRRKVSLLFAIVVLLIAGIAIYFAVPAIFGSVVVPLPAEYQGIITDKARKYNVDSCLIAAIINGESRWASRAQSYVGAQGLMQVMPATGEAVARRFNIPYSRGQISNADTNIELGTALTRYNIDHYGSLRNILVAYNAGGGRVRLPDSQLPRETQFYIGKISRYYDLYASVYPDFCTGPSLIGKAVRSQPGRSQPAASPTIDLPDFTPPPTPEPVNLKIESFWRALLTQ